MASFLGRSRSRVRSLAVALQIRVSKEKGSRAAAPLKRCALYQAVRLPVKGKEPNEPALTLPDSLSPSTVPVKSRVSGMGELILADHVTLLPSTLPFSGGPEPCAACWVPVRGLPLV